MRANRLLVAAAALLIAALPAHADQLLGPGRITGSDPANGDIVFGGLKLGKTLAGKKVLQPDSIEIQGSGITCAAGAACNGSALNVTLPGGTTLSLPNAFIPTASTLPACSAGSTVAPVPAGQPFACGGFVLIAQ